MLNTVHYAKNIQDAEQLAAETSHNDQDAVLLIVPSPIGKNRYDVVNVGPNLDCSDNTIKRSVACYIGGVGSV